MKWSGGPIVARAIVAGFREFEHCTPEQLRAATNGTTLYGLQRYWDTLPPAFVGLAVFVRDEEWLDEPIEPTGRANRNSWLVLEDRDKAELWLASAPTGASLAAAGLERKGGRRIAISARLRFTVLRRDDFACRYCGRRSPEVVLHVDHIVSVRDGGTNDLGNLTAACADCNLGKGPQSLRAV